VIRFFAFVIAAAVSTTATADKDFSSWRKHSSGQLISETTSLAPGSTGSVGLLIHLRDKWHTYWVNPGDSGTPIRLKFKNSHGIKIKQISFPVPERIQAGPLVTFGYSEDVLLPIEVDIAPSLQPGDTAKFSVDAEWLVCEDVCIPAFDHFELEVPITRLEDVKPSPKHFELFKQARALLPVAKDSFPHLAVGDSTVELKVGEASGREFVDFFPYRNSGLTNAKAEVLSKDPLHLKFEKSTVPQADADRVGVLVTRKDGRTEAWAFGESGWKFEEAGAQPKQSLWWMLVSAFLGGLILNLMPCVFPILSLKLLSLMKLTGSQSHEVRRQNFAYVAGVMVSFLLIALLLAGLRSAGNLIGWGFQLQSPVFLSILSWLFFALSLNLLGFFEIDFLNLSVGGKLTRSGGIIGSFFTGVLAVVVASPCTAPFMGVALGFGLTQSTAVLFAVFLSLGFGLAFPYLLFGILPGMIRVLPRPGKWMNTFKQVMAFPLLLTTLWLIWVLGQVRGINSVMVVLTGCLGIGFAVWFSSWRKKAAQVATALIILGGLVFIYRSEQQVKTAVESDIWQPYTESLLESLKGKNVFVNMTADWCLTCKVNERLVFNDADVMKLLQMKNMVLVKGDWTQRNEAITRFLSRFDRVGVPFYVLYSPQHPQGQILPEVLTKSSFMELIQKEYP
jgi:thiol:disulfide interchange protein DsbD